MDDLFEQHRAHLHGVARRLLGSTSEADDAVQEAWLRYERADTSEVENLGGWLTTVVARISLNMLRARRDEPMPEPLVLPAADGPGPEDEALAADDVGLALLVVLETLSPAERLAFVLHDVFALPFDEIAGVVEKTPDATRQLASRARRRVRGAAPRPDVALPAQREVVDAFLAAARDGDFDGLLAVLDPEVTLRADLGPGQPLAVARGAREIASRASSFSRPGYVRVPATVDGRPGAVVLADGVPYSVMGFAVAGGKIVAVEIFADPERVAAMDLSAFV